MSSKRCRAYVPGYRLLNEPQFDDPSLEFRRAGVGDDVHRGGGRGRYLPPYAGNLDIMTAAATKVGEEIAKQSLVAEGAQA